jgi:hypothetical protein
MATNPIPSEVILTMCGKPENAAFVGEFIGALVVAVLVFWLLGGGGLASFISVVIVLSLVSALARGITST